MAARGAEALRAIVEHAIAAVARHGARSPFLHEDPHVPNESRAGKGMRLRPGLVIAIERAGTRRGHRRRAAHPHVLVVVLSRTFLTA
jgi:methionine aminopeptidase